MNTARIPTFSKTTLPYGCGYDVQTEPEGQDTIIWIKNGTEIIFQSLIQGRIEKCAFAVYETKEAVLFVIVQESNF
jgi:hypothetical protein